MAHPSSSNGTDGSIEARLSRLEHGAASGDWLTGRVAAIDAHLARATEQLDGLSASLDAARKDALALDERQAARLEAMAAKLDELRKDAASRDEREAARFQQLEKHSEQWVSTLPPGWRRAVGLLAAVVVLVLQVLAALRMEIR